MEIVGRSLLQICGLRNLEDLGESKLNLESVILGCTKH